MVAVCYDDGIFSSQDVGGILPGCGEEVAGLWRKSSQSVVRVWAGSGQPVSRVWLEDEEGGTDWGVAWSCPHREEARF